MALSIAEQHHAAETAATCTQLLELDVVWTTGLEGGVPEGKTEASGDLINVGLSMATALGQIHERVSFLGGFADQLEGLLLEQGGQIEGWTLDLSPMHVPGLVRDAVKYVDNHATEEIAALLAKVERLEGGQAVQGDLRRRMRGYLFILGAAVSLALGTLAAAGGGPVGVALGVAGVGVAQVFLTQGLSDVRA
ncbi:hypothetical protein OG455_37530 [Kitasatospora sp. NBC_01287]|uniref:hypothetical protein n=1 Tax=Kitasatospora sp. NBC_01287 TaxID=2903573 RepID=UPI00224F04D2|nr:hypothetical protein [Kitasatospora sp. NBC_01287]MCX4751144.1 hypothetical protein [Kitasatospora sp. NBC_01287]